MKLKWNIYRFYLIYILIVGLVLPASAIKWLSLVNGSQKYWNQTSHCLKSRKEEALVSYQVRKCKENLELMRIILHAAQETMTVCQELFKDRRWNCSSITKAPRFTSDLTGGSREQAYVYAISSASLAQAVAKACALGLSAQCSCGKLPRTPPEDNFKWEGCGDDVDFGLSFSQQFADAPYTKGRGRVRKVRTHKKAMVNLHNNNAGRAIVRESLKTTCKCHGVSGSCSIKTCWKSLPVMLTIGTTIQRQYAVGLEVKQRRKKGNKRLVPLSKLVKRDLDIKDLVYYTKSPDYCLADGSTGSVGTRGRECKKDERGSGGCGSMCCGRGYTSKRIQVKHRCDCKYYWCCYVKCKTCVKIVEINRCV